MPTIIPGHFCDDCAERGREQVPAVHELDAWGVDSGGGGFLCDNCMGNRYDAAQEAKLADCWGSSQPVTLQEQYDAAARERAELRRKD